jgi:hypothetical protein
MLAPMMPQVMWIAMYPGGIDRRAGCIGETCCHREAGDHQRKSRRPACVTEPVAPPPELEDGDDRKGRQQYGAGKQAGDTEYAHHKGDRQFELAEAAEIIGHDQAGQKGIGQAGRQAANEEAKRDGESSG